MNQKILYLTDLSYRAKGRVYSEEDIYITDRLKEHFDVVLCHPQCAESFEDAADGLFLEIPAVLSVIESSTAIL